MTKNPKLTREYVERFRLDHCRPCSDAEITGNSRYHADHTDVIQHGPLAGQPCGCTTCARPEWRPPWYIRVLAKLVELLSRERS